jgi:ribonucleoside-diphosphate reductase beta chain
MTVFNKDNTAYQTADYPLFLGQPLALHDSIHTVYPKIFEAYKELKSLDWSEDEVDLTQSRMDLNHTTKEERDFVTMNLAYQWEADSIVSRSIAPLIAPFVTNSEFWIMECYRTQNEGLHTLTYSEIVRQCYNDPAEVFNLVMKNDQVLDRGTVIAKVFDELEIMGAKYTLGIHTEDRAGLMKYLVAAYVALYALEQIEFMASFACTFAMAEQNKYVGIAKLVQKICNDEIIHARKMNVAVLDGLLADPDGYTAFLTHRDYLKKIVDEVVQTEFTWNEYLFSEGRKVVGLTKDLLDDWIKWNAQVVYDFLGLELPFERITENPLLWMDDWFDIDVIQNANQEADNTNYKLNSVVYTLSDDEILDF